MLCSLHTIFTFLSLYECVLQLICNIKIYIKTYLGLNIFYAMMFSYNNLELAVIVHCLFCSKTETRGKADCLGGET